MTLESTTSSTTYHKSVLVREVIHYLAPKPSGVYVDATFGGGGHTRAILEHEPTCRVIACDWDRNAIDTNIPPLKEEFGDRIDFVWGNFAQLPHLLKKAGYGKVDGILADFGTSQFQITNVPGFSFKQNLPLDMRMSTSHFVITAADIVNRASEAELADIFWKYGEERNSRKIARLIVEARKRRPFKTTHDLVNVITSITPVIRGKIHPATRVFQALRIQVNNELENIETFLKHLEQLLLPGGRAVCISFHSLEDRLVKQFIRGHKELFIELTPKVVIADEAERFTNPSSRSAKLRAAEIVSELG
ncbi:TPA: 16S rRNA (cytosine(1402)-N(4))-methyltransferase [Candidatus Dependentiae bacterium]|nr:MAG: Ribosomal RNA small subunit methyltransferase H [candidate division TM6 bacterium GW2011_GWF2_43_87]HBL98682.1 16S rRNA (cytosine(1402)-N(4))-methyltransferase [Candidatus Dependentiae bacterium]